MIPLLFFLGGIAVGFIVNDELTHWWAQRDEDDWFELTEEE